MKTNTWARWRPFLLAGLILVTPAFYMMLAGPGHWGSVFYLGAAILFGVDAMGQRKRRWRPQIRKQELSWDGALMAGAILSAWPSAVPWEPLAWVLRLGYCAVVFLRMFRLMIGLLGPRNLVQILVLGAFLLAVSGGGFYLLEPDVRTYADGVWLAFATAATVGYGDIVPSTAGSRVFAFFIVLLGYGLFSMVTASIAAFFVGEDEKRLQREMHEDIRQLRSEIHDLREEVRALKDAP